MAEFDLLSKPVTHIAGDIELPGDKSISHRALILAAIARGRSEITGLSSGEDCLRTLEAFKSMGLNFQTLGKGKLRIDGLGKYGLQKPKGPIDCGNSGTSMRLLSGLLVAQPFNSVLFGDESLSKRPMERVGRPLSQMGAKMEMTDGRSPIIIQGGQSLRGITYAIPEASAQVKTALLLAGLYAKSETVLIEKETTRDHSERMLRAFSCPIIQKGEKSIALLPNAECIGTEISIPGDLSAAAFFIVAACLVPGAKLKLRNVGINPSRIGLLHILKQMGANIEISNERAFGEEPVADLCVQSAVLHGIKIPPSWVSLAIDEFPIIFIAAARALGETIIPGLQELRHKESDRIASMVQGLQTLGIAIHANGPEVRIQGGRIQGGVVESFKDHRIAMAFSIAGALASAPVLIKNCSMIKTSFPAFVNTAKAIHLAVEEMSYAEN